MEQAAHRRLQLAPARRPAARLPSWRLPEQLVANDDAGQGLGGRPLLPGIVFARQQRLAVGPKLLNDLRVDLGPALVPDPHALLALVARVGRRPALAKPGRREEASAWVVGVRSCSCCTGLRAVSQAPCHPSPVVQHGRSAGVQRCRGRHGVQPDCTRSGAAATGGPSAGAWRRCQGAGAGAGLVPCDPCQVLEPGECAEERVEGANRDGRLTECHSRLAAPGSVIWDAAVGQLRDGARQSVLGQVGLPRWKLQRKGVGLRRWSLCHASLTALPV